VLIGNITRVPLLWQGAFGGWGLGWLDTPMPTLVSLGSTGVIVAVLFFALGKSRRSRIWTAAAITFLAAAVPLYVLQRNLNYVGENVQPRYILPLLIVIAGVLLLAFERKGVTFTRPQAWIIAVVLIAAGSLALFTNLKRYVAGLSDETLINLDANAQWWWAIPISPLAMWVVGSVSYALVVIAVMYLARHGERRLAEKAISA
jgi:drug/metabolite transporter (DMT)-like permease